MWNTPGIDSLSIEYFIRKDIEPIFIRVGFTTNNIFPEKTIFLEFFQFSETNLSGKKIPLVQNWKKRLVKKTHDRASQIRLVAENALREAQIFHRGDPLRVFRREALSNNTLRADS